MKKTLLQNSAETGLAGNGKWVKTNCRIEGMHCAGCAGRVKSVLSRLEGVREVEVNLANEKAYLEIDRESVSVDALTRAVEDAGYRLIPEESGPTDTLDVRKQRERDKLSNAAKNLWFSWAITLPGMVLMLIEMLTAGMLFNPLFMDFMMVISVSLVTFIPGRETLSSAWRSALGLNPNMDVLITLGTQASLITGLFAMAGNAGLMAISIHNFAGIGAMIMSFHLTGRFIETKARGRASEAITKLLRLQARSATVLRDGIELEIPLAELTTGEIVVVRPGETIPADGRVVEGVGAVNESLLTGESLPVQKEAGSEVIGGTINVEGALQVRVEGVGEETFLSRVVGMVEEAQGSRVPIQEYADRVTSFFVPVVLLLSLLTFFSWLVVPGVFHPLIEWAAGYLPWVETGSGILSSAFFAALAVLVIACPCALGLATPTALMVGTGLGAENGVLIRRGEAVQRLNEATHIVFDKTGTLTTGTPEVTDVIFHKTDSPGSHNRQTWYSADDDEIRESALMSRLNSVEHMSEHPVGRAIARYLLDLGIRQESSVEFTSCPGMGVYGLVNGCSLYAGNRDFMQRFHIELDPDLEETVSVLENGGKSVTYVAVDKTVEALLAVSDSLKEEAPDVIRALKSGGLNIVLMTGDNETVARSIAKQAGIERVLAGVKPDGKAREIRNLQELGAVVVMVGDGINDAPSLATADVGIAIGTGTDIAIESGGIILVDGSLTSLLKAIRLSHVTFRKIRQNLFWAFFYNIVMIPLAVTGILHPLLAEAAMAFSSINVVTNSRRIRISP